MKQTIILPSEGSIHCGLYLIEYADTSSSPIKIGLYNITTIPDNPKNLFENSSNLIYNMNTGYVESFGSDGPKYIKFIGIINTYSRNICKSMNLDNVDLSRKPLKHFFFR